MTTARDALSGLIDGLMADGYRAEVTEKDEAVRFTITAGPDVCEDCLSPRSIMEPMIAFALREAGLNKRIELVYPTER